MLKKLNIKKMVAGMLSAGLLFSHVGLPEVSAKSEWETVDAIYNFKASHNWTKQTGVSVYIKGIHTGSGTHTVSYAYGKDANGCNWIIHRDHTDRYEKNVTFDFETYIYQFKVFEKEHGKILLKEIAPSLKDTNQCYGEENSQNYSLYDLANPTVMDLVIERKAKNLGEEKNENEEILQLKEKLKKIQEENRTLVERSNENEKLKGELKEQITGTKEELTKKEQEYEEKHLLVMEEKMIKDLQSNIKNEEEKNKAMKNELENQEKEISFLKRTLTQLSDTLHEIINKIRWLFE